MLIKMFIKMYLQEKREIEKILFSSGGLWSSDVNNSS